MGFTPQQINDMSIWQYASALEGYIAANSTEDAGLSDKETDELWDWLQAKG